jgi:hypothetical protein
MPHRKPISPKPAARFAVERLALAQQWFLRRAALESGLFTSNFDQAGECRGKSPSSSTTLGSLFPKRQTSNGFAPGELANAFS